MSEESASPVVIAIEVDDPALRDRLAALLGGVAGLALASPGESVDATIVERNAPPRAEPSESELTPRELDVLELMAEGASNKAIARRLGISVHTAKFHVGSILDKLDATGRTDAVAHAARRGVIEL
ncbi:MAG: helix-turn-helix transcriptional regulator [Bradyrhizobium sp.]|uniref:response regulator transcription factor n=1 Tax=Bradyrhizobium sp. TaxID=376 RepID=UPI001DB6E696|nr:LuxR C-terminal-related transcriptional regulator [Bradyrhizobium sp.]MBV9560868.1 helix-turn-helix transcriptional regulator [Bradyrhizobium sp.]